MKFTLRDLFWLLALVAVCLAWWMETRKSRALAEKIAAAEKKEADFLKSYGILDQQYRHLMMKLAEEGYGFHFDIIQYPTGKVDVRFVEDNDKE